MFKSHAFGSAPHLRTQSNLCFLERCFKLQQEKFHPPSQNSYQPLLRTQQKQSKISLKKKNSIQSKSTKKSQIKLESIASSSNIKNEKYFNMKRSQTSVFTNQFKDTAQNTQKLYKKHFNPSNFTRYTFPKIQLTNKNHHNNFKLAFKQHPEKQKPFEQIQIKNLTKNLCTNKKSDNCMSPAVTPQYKIQIHFQAQQQKWNQKYQEIEKLGNSVDSVTFVKNDDYNTNFFENKQIISIATMQTLGLSPNDFKDAVSVNLQSSKNSKNDSFESFVIGRQMK